MKNSANFEEEDIASRVNMKMVNKSIFSGTNSVITDRTTTDGTPDKNNKEINQNNTARSGPGQVTVDAASLPTDDCEMSPPDGGWGWVVAIGSFINTTLLSSSGPCFGILFSGYLLQEGTSSSTVAWIFNLQCFLWNIVAPLVGPLAQECGWKVLAVVGSVMASFSLVLSAFTASPEFLFFSFSVLNGLGGGIVFAVCVSFVPTYFTRLRGRANAFTNSGICMGQILLPPLVRFLQNEFGFKGATMILGAIFLHSCIGASFFQPVEWHMKRTPVRENTSGTQAGEGLLSTPDSDRPSRQEGSAGSLPRGEYLEEVSGPRMDYTNVIAQARLRRQQTSRHISEASYTSRVSSVALGTSILDIQNYVPNSDTGGQTCNAHNSSSFCSVVVRVVRSTVSSLSSLRSPRVCIISLSASLCVSSYLNFLMMVPFAMQAIGHSLDSAAWCLSIYAVYTIVPRMSVCLLSDYAWFNIQACYMFGYATVFAANFVFPFLTDLRWLKVTMAVFGIGLGANMGLLSLTIIEVMGMENLTPVFGACCFMIAIGFLSVGPLVGVIRDVSGSYTVSVCVLAGMDLIALILWLFMPAAKRHDRRRAQGQNTRDSKA